MKKITLITAMLACAAVVVQADVSANFTGSTADTFDPTSTGTITTPANLNLGTVGGTWSGISANGFDTKPTVAVLDGYAATTDNALFIGRHGNDIPHVSTATLTFDAAQTLAGTTVSFDAAMHFDGGGDGQMFITLMDGATAVARIGLATGSLSGSIRHYSTINQGAAGSGTFFLDGTDLGGSYQIWNTGNTTLANVQLNLGALNYGVSTTDAAVTDIASSGLSYVNGATTFDSIVFSAEGSKAGWGIDNINVIPEPATLGMVAAMGGGILFIRRRLMM